MEQLELQFIHREITRGLRDIYAAQRNIASSRIYQEGHDRKVRQGSGRTVRGRSLALMAALTHPSDTVWSGTLSVHALLKYPLYIRFLDMKRHGNFKIYNRQIWGILYKETFQNIRYGFADWLREQLREDLRQCFQQ